MDEKELLLYYRQTGNLSALGKLYSPYMSLLYGVCLKYLQDSDKSQDAVMQIFEELVDKLRTHEVGSFKSWLYVYARNFCLMQLRREKPHSHVDIDTHLYESEQQLARGDAADDFLDQDFERLESCLQTLNTAQRQCIRFFFLEKKCYKEIVEQTGYDLNKVKSYIQNGKRNLKLCMEKSNGK